MKVVIIGSGSWGTALANVLADNHVDVTIYGINEDQVTDINENNQNSFFFKDILLNSEIKATGNFSVVEDADIILIATPSGIVKKICLDLYPILKNPVYIINVAKGFDPDTNDRLQVTIKDNLKEKLKSCISLIGPSHAEEVVIGLLTSVNAVSDDLEAAKIIQKIFSNNYFRVYTNTDVVGAEIGVALKNVMALASGILHGQKQGDNARAALMTRGLAEITRFGVANGADPQTYLGLCGVGDLIVTCTSVHSRNYQAGIIIGQADSADYFLKNNKKTVEGIKACKSVHAKASEIGVEMPITNEIYSVLYEGKKPSEAIDHLMARSLKSE